MLGSLTIDWRDAEFHIYNPPFSNALDIRIDFFDPTIITFKHYPATESNANNFYNIDTVNRNIKMWELFGTGRDHLPYSKGLFESISEFIHYPIDGKPFYLGQYEYYKRTNILPGELGMNLLINHNVTTRDTLIDTITNIIVSKKSSLAIAKNKIFDMITPSVPINGYNNLIIEDTATLSLDSNSAIFVHHPNRLTLRQNSFMKTYGNSAIHIESGALFCDEGVIRVGPVRITFQSGIHQLCSSFADIAAKDSTNIVLSDSSILEIPDNYTLHISGRKSSLLMKPNSKIKFGENSKIVFDSSATFIANGAFFTSLDSAHNWDGIVLNNSDADTITNCTFSNAVTALTIRNDANSSYKNRIITGNTFNIPSGGNCKGIYGENNYRILIKNNTFNMPVYNSIVNPLEIVYVGIYLKNPGTGGSAGETEENEESPYSLNIVENTFSNGCASVILANYLSNLLPYNISKNTFNDAATVNIIGMQITGRIKNNNFTSDNVPLGIHLISSDPELYNNTVESRDVALHLSGHCYPKLGPYLSGSDMVWAGGKNTFSSIENDNIQLSSAGIVYSDWGNNSFNITDSSSYHIFGFADSALTTFYARDNCWDNSGNALLSITKYNTQFIVPTVYYNASYECNYNPYVTGWNVHNLGNGIYDSIKITENITGYEPSEEEILLYTALNYSYNYNYPEAIAAYKSLIETDTSFVIIATAVDFLYSNYQALDTSSDQNYRNDLYYDLILFLEPRSIASISV